MLSVPDGEVWFQSLNLSAPGIPLLCLHGGPGMPHDYLEPLAKLADERPLIFYDQLGCGRSAVADGTVRWTTGRFVRELAAIRQQLGLDEVILFGNSWGGMLAMKYLLGQPSGVLGLVLSSAPVSVKRWLADAAQLRAALPKPVQAVLTTHEQRGFYSCPEYQGAVAEFYRRHLCRVSPWPDCLERTFARLGAEVYLQMWGPSEFGPVTGALRDWELTGRLGEITVPTLITGGRFDEASPEHMASLAAGIPGAELSIFERSSHTAFIEEEAAYLDRVRRFLNTVDARR
ncbi:MAG: proline iminopeptidase-family hydrolase [Candidatus Dormibacteria bacterium]